MKQSFRLHGCQATWAGAELLLSVSFRFETNVSIIAHLRENFEANESNATHKWLCPAVWALLTVKRSAAQGRRGRASSHPYSAPDFILPLISFFFSAAVAESVSQSVASLLFSLSSRVLRPVRPSVRPAVLHSSLLDRSNGIIISWRVWFPSVSDSFVARSPAPPKRARPPANARQDTSSRLLHYWFPKWLKQPKGPAPPPPPLPPSINVQLVDSECVLDEAGGQADRQTISSFIIIKRVPRSSKLDAAAAAAAATAASRKRPRPPGDICCESTRRGRDFLHHT